jgi:hypothetical protein
VQVLAFDAVRTLVALGWVAAGFLYELGVTLEWAEVRLLARLGGGEERATRPPGKIVLTRGLRRLLDSGGEEEQAARPLAPAIVSRPRRRRRRRISPPRPAGAGGPRGRRGPG